MEQRLLRPPIERRCRVPPHLLAGCHCNEKHACLTSRTEQQRRLCARQHHDKRRVASSKAIITKYIKLIISVSMSHPALLSRSPPSLFFSRTMKLNTFIVALALSTSAVTLAAPVPQGFGAAKKLLGKVKSIGKSGESSAAQDLSLYVSESQPVTHPSTLQGHGESRHVSREPSPERTPSVHSRGDSPEPLSPPQIRQSIPGTAMMPYHPPPPQPPREEYRGMYYTGPPSVVHQPHQPPVEPPLYRYQNQYAQRKYSAQGRQREKQGGRVMGRKTDAFVLRLIWTSRVSVRPSWNPARVA